MFVGGRNEREREDALKLLLTDAEVMTYHIWKARRLTPLVFGMLCPRYSQFVLLHPPKGTLLRLDCLLRRRRTMVQVRPTAYQCGVLVLTLFATLEASVMRVVVAHEDGCGCVQGGPRVRARWCRSRSPQQVAPVVRLIPRLKRVRRALGCALTAGPQINTT